MLDTLIPQEDADAAKELAKQFGKRGIALQLGKQCTKVEDDGSQLTVHFGDGETVAGRPDARLRRPRPARRGARARGRSASSSTSARASPPTSTAARPSRTSTRSATAPATGSSRTPRSARARSPPRTRAATTRSSTTARCRGRSTPTRRSPASASPRREAREQYGDDVAVGQFPWVANARAVMQDETVGWVKSIHETRYGELLGLVMVGPHVTDMIEAGVVAIDAESTVETVADGMAPHPTLSEAIKEAGLVALGRAIHVPNRKPRAKPRVSPAQVPASGISATGRALVHSGACRPRPGDLRRAAAQGLLRSARRQGRSRFQQRNAVVGWVTARSVVARRSTRRREGGSHGAAAQLAASAARSRRQDAAAARAQSER